MLSSTPHSPQHVGFPRRTLDDTMQLTHESRNALERSRLFLRLAANCAVDQRVEFEAFIEAAIVFARAELHRLQARHKGHAEWKTWWDSLLGNPAVEFFRAERDWLLKEAPPKIGQRGFAASVGSSRPRYEPSKASDFYFFESPDAPAIDTVSHHLNELERVLKNGEATFV